MSRPQRRPAGGADAGGAAGGAAGYASPAEPRQETRHEARHDPRHEPPVSEYAKRPAPQAPQGLDQHGRQAPVHNSGEEDQLDIPAFLRRQAN